MKINNKNLI